MNSGPSSFFSFLGGSFIINNIKPVQTLRKAYLLYI